VHSGIDVRSVRCGCHGWMWMGGHPRAIVIDFSRFVCWPWRHGHGRPSLCSKSCGGSEVEEVGEAHGTEEGEVLAVCGGVARGSGKVSPSSREEASKNPAGQLACKRIRPDCRAREATQSGCNRYRRTLSMQLRTACLAGHSCERTDADDLLGTSGFVLGSTFGIC
jgi:hypothetical protein